MQSYRVMLIGPGNLGTHLLDLLLSTPGTHQFLVGGRTIEKHFQRAHLSLFTALQLGYSPELFFATVDLWDIDQTADTLARFQPDILFCTATLHTHISRLPENIARQLAQAPAGPRLPLHLALVHRLMQAVKRSGHHPIVLNAVYPDVINRVLSSVGLAPTSGIGDLANTIPPLREAIRLQLNRSREDLDVRLVAARSTVYRMARTQVRNAPLHLTVYVNGEDVTPSIDQNSALDLLSTRFKRPEGPSGVLMTASSAARVFAGLLNQHGILTHAPGPGGLPGGYPIRVSTTGIELALPHHLSQEEAIQINEAGLLLDGIKRIEPDGTVHFTEQSLAVYRELLGYHCARLPLAEVENRAQELQTRYNILAGKYS